MSAWVYVGTPGAPPFENGCRNYIPPVTINLEAACLEPACSDLAFRMRNQLDTPKYAQGAALMPVPDTLAAWRAEHRTARKRADRAERLGYRFDTIDRSQHNDAIHEINTSLDQRQGRPMGDGYLKRHNHGPLPEYRCERHRVHTYGVLQEPGGAASDTPGHNEDSILRAYLSLYRVGDLALVSMILGHGDHMDAGIMYLLFQGTVAEQAGQGGYFFYNRFDSGGDGLRFYKQRLGFVCGDIEWRL